MSLLQNIKNCFRPQKQPNRLPIVRHAIEALIAQQQTSGVNRDHDLDWEIEHIEGSVHYAKVLAVRRRLDPDFAACAVALQNVGRIVYGTTKNHAEAGYTVAKGLLRQLECFTPQEVEQLATSVGHHSNKHVVESPLDELGKDVDVYVRFMQGHDFDSPHEMRRLNAVRMELQNKE